MNIFDAKIYGFLLGLRFKNDQVINKERIEKINELNHLV